MPGRLDSARLPPRSKLPREQPLSARRSAQPLGRPFTLSRDEQPRLAAGNAETRSNFAVRREQPRIATAVHRETRFRENDREKAGLDGRGNADAWEDAGEDAREDGNAMESSRLRRRSNSTESCRLDARGIGFYPAALVVDRPIAIRSVMKIAGWKLAVDRSIGRSVVPGSGRSARHHGYFHGNSPAAESFAG